MSGLECSVFRCSKKDEMYLYLPYGEDKELLINSVPDGLLKLTGQLDHVMDLELAEERKLARADVIEVIKQINENGFYLQMPPNAVIRKDDSMLNNSSDSF